MLLAIPFTVSRLGGYWSATYGTTISAAVVALIVVSLTFMQDFWLSKTAPSRRDA